MNPAIITGGLHAMHMPERIAALIGLAIYAAVLVWAFAKWG